jgi:AraC-like DNA-binding protein
MSAEFLKLGSSTGASQSSGRLPCLLYQADFLYVGRIGTPYPCFESPVPNQNVYAFGFVEAGHLWLSTPKDARSVVAQGQYYLLTPDQEHSHELNGNPRTLFINFPPSRVDAVREELGNASTVPSPGPIIHSADRQVRATLNTITEEATYPSSGTRLMMESLSLQLLIQLMRVQQRSWKSEGDHLGSTLSPEIRRSIDFIHAHYGDDISLDRLAAVASMSRYHYLRVFKRATGLTPYAYLRNVQLQQAAILLRTSDASISEIALHLGFASPGHLTDAFKRRYGMTPSAFRSDPRRNQT